MISIDIIGRIDEFMDMDTPEKLYQYLCEVAGVQELSPKEEHPQTSSSNVTHDPNTNTSKLEYGSPSYSIEDFDRLKKMYEPLGLMPGTYMVTGIEGKFHPEYDEDTPWPLHDVREEYSAFDIMVLVESSEANGYPHVNHVWFEGMDIDVMAMTIHFSMGS